MKKLFLAGLFLLLATSALHAQEILSKREWRTTGFFAISVQGTQFHKKFQPVAGISGGWIINKVIGVGLKLNIVPPNHSYDDLGFEPIVPVGAYGGIVIEPVIWSDKLVHMTIPVSIGWGAILFLKDWNYDSGSSDNLLDGDYFKYIEPEINAELNLLSNLRVALGVGGRLTSALNLDNTHPRDFSGLNYSLTLKFGRY